MGNVRILAVRNSQEGGGGMWEFLRSLWPDRKTIKVNLYDQPYWSESGWTKEGSVFKGKYATKYGAWDGMIADRAGEFEIFIVKPPQELRRHPHWQCFQRVGKPDIFKVHVTEQPNDVGSAILNIERMLTEAFKL